MTAAIIKARVHTLIRIAQIPDGLYFFVGGVLPGGLIGGLFVGGATLEPWPLPLGVVLVGGGATGSAVGTGGGGASTVALGGGATTAAVVVGTAGASTAAAVVVRAVVAAAVALAVACVASTCVEPVAAPPPSTAARMPMSAHTPTIPPTMTWSRFGCVRGRTVGGASSMS